MNSDEKVWLIGDSPGLPRLADDPEYDIADFVRLELEAARRDDFDRCDTHAAVLLVCLAKCSVELALMSPVGTGGPACVRLNANEWRQMRSMVDRQFGM